MPQGSSFRLVAGIAFGLAALSGAGAAATAQTAPIVDQHSDLARGSGSRTSRELSTRFV